MFAVTDEVPVPEVLEDWSGSLELDLSFAPASEFGAGGPKFRLLFGGAVDQALHARVCIERGGFWQAEYWISALRDHALHLACRRGPDGHYGRDFDELPDVLVGRPPARSCGHWMTANSVVRWGRRSKHSWAWLRGPQELV